MSTESPTAFATARPYIRALLVIAALRYLLDWFRNPTFFDAFGVYAGSLAMMLTIAFTGSLREPSLGRTLKVTTWIAFCAWWFPNFVSYLTAQWIGWTHGRFAEGRAAPPAPEVAAKFANALSTACLTTVAGILWCGILGILCIWLPTRWSKTSTTAA